MRKSPPEVSSCFSRNARCFLTLGYTIIEMIRLAMAEEMGRTKKGTWLDLRAMSAWSAH